MDLVIARNPGENDFHQAVSEVADTILPYIDNHLAYQDAGLMERLTEPDRIIQFRVEWVDDDNNPRVNRAWRVQFNNALGPYKGGLRFRGGLQLGTLKFLAFEQCFKNALTGLPMGGGKGGADFDPKSASVGEIKRFCQAMMDELHRHIGPNTDVPAGDIGVGQREIGYLFGRYIKLTNEFTGTLTGKGVSFGGSEIRTEATGYGLIYFAQDMLAEIDDTLAGKRCVVTGAGNVALHAVEQLIKQEAIAITLSDTGGMLYAPDGFTQDQLDEIKRVKVDRRGRLADLDWHWGHVEYHDSGDPFGVECFAAFPCATQNELQASHARTLIDNGCQLVAEGANMPSTDEAIKLLREGDVLFGPAKAANAGGVAVSGLEMTQNAAHLSWDQTEVNNRLKKIMHQIHTQCVKHGSNDQRDGRTDYVTGANIAGFKRLADAMLAYGV
jgi:glutamate dehydrogenase (NADP+)